jgi:hypothetical protein
MVLYLRWIPVVKGKWIHGISIVKFKAQLDEDGEATNVFHEEPSEFQDKDGSGIYPRTRYLM